MKKRLHIGVFVLIAIFSLTSFALADDNVEKAFGLISEALKMANKHEYEKMVDLCSQAIRAAPNLSLGYLTRAKGYSALGESKKSQADYQKSIELAKIEASRTSDLAKPAKERDTAIGFSKGDRTVADREPAGDTGYSVYFRPGVRFGSDSRALYIMDLLVPFYQDDRNIVFGNIKYTPNNHDGWEINAGVGYRRLLWDDKLILGANAYYDQRKTDWGTNHRQWGMGLEAMAVIPLEPFDLGLTARLNYYHPLSDTKIDGLGTAYASYVLSDTGIILNSGRVEEPMHGIDYEAGMRIPYLSDYVETWAYVGGYNYFGSVVDNVNGFQARLEIIPTDFIRLNYEFHHDNYSKAQHYGEVTLEVPFSIGNLVTGKNPFEGIGDMLTGSRDLKERMVEPTKRDVDIKVIVDEENDNIPGAGDQIEDVVFVSETGDPINGDGTKDNPYATITLAMADAKIVAGTCRTIHVMNSSPTAVIADNPTIGVANMLLWGSGADHPKYSNILNMPYSGHPTINDTLELNALNPEVAGLGFNVAGSEYSINILAGAGGSGIKITNNIFSMSRAGNAYGIYASFGAQLGTEANPIIIANNTFDIESTGSYAYGIYVRVTGANNDIFANITNNDMSGGIWGDDWAFGIYLRALGSNIGSVTNPVTISGNRMTVTANTTDALGMQLYASYDIFATITGNDLSSGIWGNNYAWGIFLRTSSGSIGSETRPVIISGNLMTVTSKTLNAYGMSLEARNDLFAIITGNDMSNTITGDEDAYGIYLYADDEIGSETRPVIISGNSMTVRSDDDEAIGMLLTGDDIFATITGNDMSNDIWGYEDGYGIWMQANGGDIGSESRPIIISGNPMTVTGNTHDAHGIYLSSSFYVFARITNNNEMNIFGANNALGVGVISGSGLGSIGSINHHATPFSEQ